MNQHLINGAVCAASIYVARKIQPIEKVMDGGVVSNGKTVPIIPADFMSKNQWSAAFWIIPAVAAYYLAKN